MITDYTKAIWHGSPNYWTNADPLNSRMRLSHIVLHGTSGLMPGTLDWLCSQDSGVSAHYLVGRDGAVYQMVREGDSAWANGVVEAGSPFEGGPNPNLWCVSIEHERDVGNTSPVPTKQLSASLALVRDILKRHGPMHIIPHSLIAPLSRAHCPGSGFPMDAFQALLAPPPAKRVRVVTAQWIRALPRADSQRLVECKVGDILSIVAPPTPHWLYVKAHLLKGWILAENVEDVNA